MAVKPLHLGWFMNFTPGEWESPLASGGSPWDGNITSGASAASVWSVSESEPRPVC